MDYNHFHSNYNSNVNPLRIYFQCITNIFRRCRRYKKSIFLFVIFCSFFFNGYLLLIFLTKNFPSITQNLKANLILQSQQQRNFTLPPPKFITVDGVDICMNRSRSLRTKYQIKLHTICPCFPAAIELPPLVQSDVEPMNSLSTIEGYDNTIQGCWFPSDCVPRWRIAVLVPYRNRTAQLSIFLRYLPAFLRSQKAAFCIFIIEQSDDDLFNRGMLLNIGVLEARRFANEHAELFARFRNNSREFSSQKTSHTSDEFFDCIALQDVDLLPLDGRILYQCASGPLHLAAGVDKYNFSLLYEEYFGGVSILPTMMFEAINGYSNFYFGWGAEGKLFSILFSI